jgi:hypothetical protein
MGVNRCEYFVDIRYESISHRFITLGLLKLLEYLIKSSFERDVAFIRLTQLYCLFVGPAILFSYKSHLKSQPKCLHIFSAIEEVMVLSILE